MKLSPLFISRIIAYSLIITALLIFSGPVLGQGSPAGLQEGLFKGESVASDNNLPIQAAGTSIILKVINFILTFVGSLAILLLIIAGVMFITSVGEPDKAAKAKNLILYVVIGLIIIMFSAIIVNTILKEALA